MRLLELPDWVLIYFEKTSKDKFKCNVCDFNLKTDGKSLELLHHITKNHNDIYKIHKENSDAPVKFQIEYLYLNDLNEQPQTKGSVCDPIGNDVIASNEKDAEGDTVEYILVQTEKPKVTKHSRKRSWVWKYFDMISKNKSRCNICSALMSGKTTGNLYRHLRGKHPAYKSEDGSRHSSPKIEFSKKKTMRRINVDADSVLGETSKKLTSSRLASSADLRKRSWIWKYFDIIGKKSRCNICNALMSIKTTGNLYRHLRGKHPAYWSEYLSRHSSPKIEFSKKKTVRRIDVDADSVLDETSEKLTSSRLSNSAEKEKTQKKYRSWIWDYYKPITKASAMCNVCKKISWHGGVAIGNMARHLRKKHQLNKDHWVWKLFEKDHDTYSCRMCDFTCTKRENDEANVIAIRDHLGSEHGIFSGKQVVEEEESSEVDDNQQIEGEDNEQVEKVQKTKQKTDVQDGKGEAKGSKENDDSE